ncbi:MAG TPA: choice-of-anchor Q domain-containing protein, partial [Paludibacter sp.]|nr:choice-of-anchor Q domain-containing protein [Paludibacter sp.]
MKSRQLLILCFWAAGIFTVFANKTIYVAPAASGTGSGIDAANPCTFPTALGNLDATGYTTLVLPNATLFQLSGGTNGYGRIPVVDNSKIIIEGNNSILEGNGGETRILRASTGCVVELKNLTFRLGNAAASLGGAIFFGWDSLKIAGCVFESNTADNGAAIGSRGKYIKITNSWFKDNYLRSSFQGGAISHTGTTSGGKLIIENTTFSNNNGKAANAAYGTAIITAFDGNVRNYLSEISITNCTFYKNNSGLNTHVGDAAIQLDFLGTTAPVGTATTATFVNNTFYGNQNCAINVKGKQQAVSLINNAIVGDSWANVSTTGVQDHGIICEYSVAEGRPALVAKNNYIVAKFPKSTKTDDAALASGNADNNILITTASQNDIDALGLSTSLSTSGSVVPYLSVSSSSSPLVEGGVNAVSGIAMFSTDTRGVVRASGTTGSKYDIGAYEFENLTTAVQGASTDSFTFNQSIGEVSVINSNNKILTVTVYQPGGQSVYSKTTNSTLKICKTQLPKGV